MAGAQTSAEGDRRAQEPFHEFRDQESALSAPQTDDPIPEDLASVAIGWFGPADADDPLHGDLWTAASLAVEQSNRDGGWHGLPFELHARWSENVWGTGVSELARMVHQDRVWAILGSVDGAATHLAEQVVAKALLPLVSPVSTDESVNLAGVPWMFSVAPGDHLWAPLLSEELLATIGEQDFVLISLTDHDSRLATGVLLRELGRRDRGPRQHLEVAPGSLDLEAQLERSRVADAAALLVVAGARDGGRLLRAVRQRGFAGPIFGSPALARRLCLEEAGEAAEGLRLPLLADPAAESPERERFEQRFRQRTGRDPDWAAAHTYDAARLLLAAVRAAGLSRSGVREALVALSPWQGITGAVDWDPTGQNRRRVSAMATVHDGRLVVDARAAGGG